MTKREIKEGSYKRQFWLAGVVLILVSAACRFHGLGEKGLWLDESISLARISGTFGEMLDDVMENDGHPPIYYACLHLATGPFRESNSEQPKFPPAGITDGVLRYPSALAGVLTVLLVLLIEFELAPEARFPLATLIATFSAFLIFFSQEARHYALAGLWTTSSTLFLIRGLKRERAGDWVCFALSSILALYTFYYSLFILVSQAIAAGWIKYRNPKEERRKKVRASLAFAAPCVAFLFYLPVVNRMREKVAAAGAPLGFGVPGIKSWLTLFSELGLGFNPLHSFSWLTLFAGGVFTLIPVAWYVSHYRTLSHESRLLLWLYLGPPVCLLVFPLKPHVFQAKHLFALAPIFCLIAGAMIRSLLRNKGSMKAVAFCSVLALINLHSIFHYKSDFIKEDWPGAVSFLVQEDVPSAIVPAPPYLKIPLTRYLKNQKRVYAPAELDPGQDLWLVELLESPVSFGDLMTKEIVAKNRKPEREEFFPGELGIIRLTHWKVRAAQ
ncbi:MAG: glycosyltransferase family 39 protein [Planctomycetota bacterium]|nr:glycosyltransferase family 39 protein [Planctomycetota bacterium]